MTNTASPFTLRSLLRASETPPPAQESTLIVVDAQREYDTGGLLALPDIEGALKNIHALLRNARTAGSLVIHIAHQGAPGMPFDPAHGGRFIEAAAPLDGELVINKTLPNAFAGTDLNDQLRKRDEHNLVIAGFMTHMCVSSTARAALDLGYNTTVVSDASATRDLPNVDDGSTMPAHELHQFALAALADRFSLVTRTEAVLANCSRRSSNAY